MRCSRVGRVRCGMVMISIIITAFKEEHSTRKAIMRFLPQIKNLDAEILVVAPDKPTKEMCKEFKDVHYIKDGGVGKPAALNQAFREAKGDILILSDGDVYPNDYAVRELIKFFYNNIRIGAVSGRPVSISPRTKLLGFWSHLLTDMADQTRRRCTKERKSIVCTGYLYAIRKKAIEGMNMPEDILSDDAFISYYIENKGYKILYAAGAQIFVKYPSTFSDWIKQKARSTGGYTQLEQLGVTPKNPMRGFKQEAKEIITIFKYGKNLKEFTWTGMLVLARIYLWLRIYYERRIKQKSFEETWTRIETTK